MCVCVLSSASGLRGSEQYDVESTRGFVAGGGRLPADSHQRGSQSHAAGTLVFFKCIYDIRKSDSPPVCCREIHSCS